MKSIQKVLSIKSKEVIRQFCQLLGNYFLPSRVNATTKDILKDIRILMSHLARALDWGYVYFVLNMQTP